MPFTGDSSDSESDGGGEGNARSVSGTRLESTERPTATKSRGINPIIINQPPTPLLTRKKHPPCTLGQVQDGVAGYYDHSVTACNNASSAFSPKYAINNLETKITNVASLQPPLNRNINTNANLLQESVSHPETKSSSTFSHTNPNGFIPSPLHSAKTPTRCAIIASSSKKLGTLYLEVEKLLSVYNGHSIIGQKEIAFLGPCMFF